MLVMYDVGTRAIILCDTYDVFARVIMKRTIGELKKRKKGERGEERVNSNGFCLLGV